MNVKEVTGAELTKDQVDTFTGIVRRAYGNSKLDTDDHLTAENVYFYLEYEGDAVAFGRYIKVEGITIGDEVWPHPVYGRSLIAVLNQHRGKGFGQMIVMRMRTYAENRNWSQIGIHGKNVTVNAPSSKLLSEFYENCGLQVDDIIGEKIFAPKNGVIHDLSHTNISYKEGDPFINAVRACKDRVVLPFSW